MLTEFRQFLLRGNLVDLAVAVAIGAAFTAVVNSVVKDLVTPLIAMIGGTPDLSRKSFEINEAIFRWGNFVTELIAFVVVAAVLFFFVIKPVNTLMARFRTEPPVDEHTRQCPACVSEIPTSARRCAFCTEEVGAIA